MELAIRVQVGELPEGAFLAISEEIPGLVAQGRTVVEALDIARDVARKLIVNLPLWWPLEWAGSPDSVIVKSGGN